MSTTNHSPKPKRRWYRFSLRTLLVVMTLFTVTVGCFVGWVQYRRQRAQENRDRVAAVEDAVAAIEELGGPGTVKSEYEDLRTRTWLEEQFDDPGSVDDPTGVLKVSSVTFWTASDTDLEHLKVMESLQSLDLFKTEITDAGLKHLKGLTNLQTLILIGTGISNAGLERLKGLTRLNTLCLSYIQVTDAGLEHLTGMTNLEFLYLEHTKVTNEGVKKLQQALPNCEIHR